MLRPLLCCTAGGLLAGAVLLTVGFPPVVDPVGPADNAADAKQPAKPAVKEIGTLVAQANEQAPPQPAPPAPLALKPGALAPVVIPEGRITIIDKQEVPALRDGQLLVLGTQLAKEQIPPERLIEIQIPNEDRPRYFRRLKEGDYVQKDQLLALIDPVLALDDMEIKRYKVVAAEADQKASEKTRDEARQRWDTMVQLRAKIAAAPEEVRGAELTYYRYVFEEVSKTQAIEYAKREFSSSKTVLRMYDIRALKPGVVKAIYKNSGDAVKNLEPVLQIQNYDNLRIEGQAELQYLPYLAVGKEVVVEPMQPERPKQELVGHLGEVTGVAVSGDLKNPVIVSGSDDGTVKLWDRTTRHERRTLRHTAPVRTVACTPPGASANLVVAGAINGTGRIWDLDKMWDVNTQNDAPQAELGDGHRRAMNCAAFSGDGKVVVTGGEDGTLILWESATGRQLYRFPGQHRNGITSVQFLPGSKLISVSRDGIIQLWTVGMDSAKAEATRFSGRTGQVTTLNATADGKKVLFDQGKELRILSLPEGHTEGVIQSPSGATNFTTLALFSPDGKLVLTAGGASGNLGLYRAPADNARAYEMRQLVSTGAPATCGAFSPDGSFVVTGTRDRLVLVWPVPPKEEFEQPLKARVTLCDRSLDVGSRHVRVWAEMPNPGGKLVPGTTATMVLYPNE